MKRYLLLGSCAALLATGGMALAQMPPPPPAGDHAAATPPEHGPNGPGMPHGPMGPHWMHMGWMRHGPPPPPPGSSFHFRRGDNRVDIHCTDREPVQACISAATTLLDKLNSAPAKTP